jgi:hypothetical protein
MSIRERIEQAQKRVLVLRQQRSQASAALDAKINAGATKSDIGGARHRYDMFDARVGAAKQRLRELQKREAQEKELTEMRHQDEFTPQSGNPSWPWRAWVTLDIEGKRYGRGAIIPDELIERCANAARLISGGYIRRLPDQPAKPAPAATTAKPVASSPTPDHIEQCRAALREASARRGVSRKAALDIIDQDLVARAIKQYADEPKVVRTGAWGSGAPTNQQTGKGTPRRIVDGFVEHVCAEPVVENAA